MTKDESTGRGGAVGLALTVFGRLPVSLRRLLVRLGTPSFTVGAVAVVRHAGQVLLLRQRHRVGWTLPGGLLRRGETPVQGLCRELREELGLTAEVPEQVPFVVVDSRARRVDLIFVLDLDAAIAPVLGDAEVVEIGWRPVDDPDVASGIREALRLARGGPRQPHDG